MSASDSRCGEYRFGAHRLKDKKVTRECKVQNLNTKDAIIN